MKRYITLFRLVETHDPYGSKLTLTYIDEAGKLTKPQYKRIKHKTYQNVWRLDGRSIRYMKHVRLVENEIPYII